MYNLHYVNWDYVNLARILKQTRKQSCFLIHLLIDLFWNFQILAVNLGSLSAIAAGIELDWLCTIPLATVPSILLFCSLMWGKEALLSSPCTSVPCLWRTICFWTGIFVKMKHTVFLLIWDRNLSCQNIGILPKLWELIYSSLLLGFHIIEIWGIFLNPMNEGIIVKESQPIQSYNSDYYLTYKQV